LATVIKQKRIGLAKKSGVEYLKEELSKEEQLLESLIRSERFVKKYRAHLFGAVIFTVVAAGAAYFYQYQKERTLLEANIAYMRLEADPADGAAKRLLEQKSPALYRLYLYKKAVREQDMDQLRKLADSDDKIIADLARYHLYLLQNDIDGLKRYKKEGILKDMARLNGAYLLDVGGHYHQAHSLLEEVGGESAAKPYAALLRHYGVGK
jgi:hypothetical protein